MKRTIEQLKEVYANKIKVLEQKELNRGVKDFWKSELRQHKGTLNKDTTKDYTQKIQALVDLIYSETGIKAIDYNIPETPE